MFVFGKGPRPGTKRILRSGSGFVIADSAIIDQVAEDPYIKRIESGKALCSLCNRVFGNDARARRLHSCTPMHLRNVASAKEAKQQAHA